MQRAAILASGTPVALDTNGTVREARAACTGMRALARLEPYRLQDLHAQLARAAAPETVS